MRIPQFAMERMQSTWENLVDYNLSESGVHPMRLEELVEDPADRAGLLGQELVYPQSNGTIELRQRVAAMYPGATADHVEVTNGGSEANFVTMWHLVEPGDEVVSMVPNYGQTLGLAEAFGAMTEMCYRSKNYARLRTLFREKIEQKMIGEAFVVLDDHPHDRHLW